MWTHNAFGDAPEQLILHLHKLGRLSQFQDFLHLVEKQHLLGSVGGRPQTKCAVEDHGRQPRVFLRILRHAIRQLLVEAVQSSHLVQRNQGLLQHDLVLLLHRERKPVDDAAQNLKQFGNSIVGVALVNDLEEEILDGLADKRPEDHELAVDPVQDGFQVVSLPRVLGIEQIQQFKHERVVNEPLGNLGVDVIGDHKPQEKLIHNLQMRPGSLKGWLVLFVVKQCVRVLVHRGQSTEDVCRHHRHHILHHAFVEAVAGVVDVFHNFQ
mmetsp:Transcript_54529/g.117139  ORF Transcript_54529/g.117139 Transcript_54529/m.117139 type:complete len:267 (-) Transcript_54529:409-1209(-)